MCRDEISRVHAVDRAIGEATVETDGVMGNISLLAMDEDASVDVGDWLVVYQGYALSIIDEATARELRRERRAAGVLGGADEPNGEPR